MPTTSSVNLGFTSLKVPVGTHICQIYADSTDRDHTLLQFLSSGLASGECSACFSDEVGEDTVGGFLAERGLSITHAMAEGRLSLQRVTESYFKNGHFDPERMLMWLADYYAQSVAAGFSNARVIGEMTDEIDRIPGGSRLMEYEAKVSLLVRQRPITAFCQYNASNFSGTTLMSVLKAHPMMVIRGNVVHNPFFIPPEEFLH